MLNDSEKHTSFVNPSNEMHDEINSKESTVFEKADNEVKYESTVEKYLYPKSPNTEKLSKYVENVE